MTQLSGAVVLVTGANRGLGKALVLGLLKTDPRKIYAGARNPQSAAELAALDPARIVPLHVDVTDRKLIETLPAKAADVTVLINNAGTLAAGSLLTLPLDLIERDLNTNFFGMLLMARAIAPIIARNGGGAIVNVLTPLALASMPRQAAYSASKAAALSMTQALRADLSAKNIAVGEWRLLFRSCRHRASGSRNRDCPHQKR